MFYIVVCFSFLKIFFDWSTFWKDVLNILMLLFCYFYLNIIRKPRFHFWLTCFGSQKNSAILRNWIASHKVSLISTFSNYNFKPGTICLLFLSSYVFTALEFDGNYFDILPWKIVKTCHHTKIKPLIKKIFQKHKSIRH